MTALKLTQMGTSVGLILPTKTWRKARSVGSLQNRKYRCAIGNTVAGSQVISTPSACTR